MKLTEKVDLMPAPGFEPLTSRSSSGGRFFTGIVTGHVGLGSKSKDCFPYFRCCPISLAVDIVFLHGVGLHTL